MCIEENQQCLSRGALNLDFSNFFFSTRSSVAVFHVVESRKKKSEVTECFSRQIITFQAVSGIYLGTVSQGSSSGRGSGRSSGPNSSSQPSARGPGAVTA